MEKTWMSKTAGILDIIAGAYNIVFPFFMSIILTVFSNMLPLDRVPELLSIILITMAIIRVLIGILAIVGGIYAIKGEKWGLALAGSIAAICAFILLGTPALVFTILGKKEFNQSTSAE
jgi:hypothetical protein